MGRPEDTQALGAVQEARETSKTPRFGGFRGDFGGF